MRAKKRLIHAYVLFHLAAVGVWACTDSPPRTKLERAARGRCAFYMYPTVLWQAWNMFAPNPAMANVYLEAEVTFRDGSRTTWKFPRMEQLGYWERYRKERYRKWANERVASGGEGPADPTLCDAAARFAARQVERPDNPAVSVDLVRYRAEIPPPSRQQLAHPSAPEWERETIYTCRLDRQATTPAAPATTAPAITPSANAIAVPSAAGGSPEGPVL